jgi:hypothetical protein
MWERDFDVMDRHYIANPYPVWDEMRTSCPVAHTDRHGGSWMAPGAASLRFARLFQFQMRNAVDLEVAP